MSYKNDIAIIKLASNAELNDYVQIACLPDPSIPSYPSKVNISAIAVGYGNTNYSSTTLSPVLRNVDLTIYSRDVCPSMIPDDAQDAASQICAGKLKI